MDPGAVLLALLGSPNLASRHAVFHQYDSTVGADTVAGPGRGAAVLRVKGTTKALVATTDGNAAVGALDPWLGAALAVAEATRNVSITGARPLGVTNCLNYGDPTRPEAFWQLTEGVRGLGRRVPRARAARHRRQRLALQRVAGRGRSRRPPRSASSGCSTTSRRWSVRPSRSPTTRSSSSARRCPGSPAPPTRTSPGPPRRTTRRRSTSPARSALQAFVREAIARGLVASAQDVSGGGLAVALAEVRHVGRARRRPSGSRRALAGGRPVRREPVAAGRDLPASLCRGARAACSPASACRSRRSDRSAATGWSSSWCGRRDRRRRGARRPRRRRARGPAPRPPSRLGPRARAARLGWEG